MGERDGRVRRHEQLSAILAEQVAGQETVRAARPVLEGLESLAECRREATEAIGRHERVAAQLQRLSVEAEELRDEILREIDLDPIELPPAQGEVPTDDEIRRLRLRANQYADADPSVVDECRELEERYTSLKDHLDDLLSASDSLRAIMDEADAEMRVRFRDAFQSVNEEFGRVFQLMFGGGSARLEEDEETGGVGIRAQLPGRKMHSSAAFSGGEKTLVATSLLFGVLRMRPAPFCVLDEVDAALDERNVDRYLNVLRDISQRTQTIVVTHNRATMACADALYGLTMDGEGASGVLSLRLDAYQAAG